MLGRVACREAELWRSTYDAMLSSILVDPEKDCYSEMVSDSEFWLLMNITSLKILVVC